MQFYKCLSMSIVFDFDDIIIVHRLMKGDNVPDSWRGGLNITYKLGPGFTNGR